MLIVAFGGSSFVMIRTAVETAPPAIVGVGRLWVGAILLYVLMRAAGRRLPPLFIRTQTKGGVMWRIRRSWRWMIAVGIVGNLLPFFIFPWAQQYVDSGLAGIYMAFMPIWTLALAYLFVGETLTRQKIIGFLLGLIGVIILLGPDTLSGVAANDIRAQAALLFAAFLYAGSAVIARRAPPIRPRVFAAGLTIVAALIASPVLLFVDWCMNDWSLVSLVSIVGLGVFPTGLNAILIIMLIRRTGASFMALSNYFTPVWAVIMGALVYNERLALTAFLALAIILVGVAISQRKSAKGKADLPAP